MVLTKKICTINKMTDEAEKGNEFMQFICMLLFYFVVIAVARLQQCFFTSRQRKKKTKIYACLWQ